MSSDQDPMRSLLPVITAMKDHTSPSLTYICGAFADHTAELVGSGTIIELGGNPYLLTAQHVARELFSEAIGGDSKYPGGLCHFAGNGEKMMWTGPRWYSWPSPQDIAIAPVDPAELANSRITSLKATRLARNTDYLDDDLYFVQGWPTRASRFTMFGGAGILARSQPFAGWLTTETAWPSFDPTIHVAITHPMSEIIDEREQPAHLLLPNGVSGSLLWKTNHVGAKHGWTPSQATVVGLVHRFDQDAQCVIATRIEYVKGLSLTMLREQYAYDRWFNRGHPINDDWADWFVAEKAVTSL